MLAAIWATAGRRLVPSSDLAHPAASLRLGDRRARRRRPDSATWAQTGAPCRDRLRHRTTGIPDRGNCGGDRQPRSRRRRRRPGHRRSAIDTGDSSTARPAASRALRRPGPAARPHARHDRGGSSTGAHLPRRGSGSATRRLGDWAGGATACTATGGGAATGCIAALGTGAAATAHAPRRRRDRWHRGTSRPVPAARSHAPNGAEARDRWLRRSTRAERRDGVRRHDGARPAAGRRRRRLFLLVEVVHLRSISISSPLLSAVRPQLRRVAAAC